MISDDLARFSQIPPSYLSHHHAECCSLAQLSVMTRLQDVSLSSALARIPKFVTWAPNPWPHFWCELDQGGERLSGDCGVHAALARELLMANGVESSNAQIAIRDFGHSIDHWSDRWLNAGLHPSWIGNSCVYHEVLYCNGKFWDPSEARWIHGVGSTIACGRVVATRIVGASWTLLS